MFRLNPLTKKKLQRFRSIRRGYYSFLLFSALVVLTMFGELFVNHRALIVRYEGDYYFPAVKAIFQGLHTGEDFGMDFLYEPDYRVLDQEWEASGSANWVLMPLVPYGPFEMDAVSEGYPPHPPSWKSHHYLGTDVLGRDVLARLFYGFRIAILFSLAFVFLSFALGIAAGCIMGYFGGKIDLLGQRAMEIWSNIPFLYIVIIVYSLIPPAMGATSKKFALLIIMVLFSWVGMAYLMRTSTYREKARDYVEATRVLGAGTGRIIFKHILPNIIAVVVTFLPFTVMGGITSLTALDFLGFGLPRPTPSWGELLDQGTSRLDAPWIVTSVFVAMVGILTLVAFIGEAIREAFDPRRFAIYR
jgi:microcin C transport system permease protein